MKILHIADVNWVGASSTFVKYHNREGHYSRMVTFVRNNLGFPEDITLNLPLVRPATHIFLLKKVSDFIHGKKERYRVEREEDRVLKVWKPRSKIESYFFNFRERLWKRRIYRAIKEYNLLDFDVYHLDGGHGFFKDGRVIRRLKERGKLIVVYYLGTDFRDRGVIEPIDSIADIRITTEFDHYRMDPTMLFEFLPVETSNFLFRKEENRRLRIFHAIRSKWNREIKGTDFIIEAMRKLEKEYDIEFLFFEGIKHKDFLKIKQECDIGIEQIGNRGGTGYGMNGIENLLMGIPTVTEFTEDYDKFLGKHPFYTVNRENFIQRMKKLIENRDLRLRLKVEGREWAIEKHGAENVVRRHHRYYEERLESIKRGSQYDASELPYL